MTSSAERLERRDALLAFSEAHPTGFTIYEAMSALACTRSQAKRSIQDLRRSLETDTMNLGYDATLARYYLVANMADSGPHRARHLADLESRLTTDLAFARSIKNGTAETDADYPVALMYESTLGHALTLANALRR